MVLIATKDELKLGLAEWLPNGRCKNLWELERSFIHIQSHQSTLSCFNTGWINPPWVTGRGFGEKDWWNKLLFVISVVFCSQILATYRVWSSERHYIPSRTLKWCLICVQCRYMPYLAMLPEFFGGGYSQSYPQKYTAINACYYSNPLSNPFCWFAKEGSSVEIGFP